MTLKKSIGEKTFDPTPPDSGNLEGSIASLTGLGKGNLLLAIRTAGRR
jgi:hypothetical protein